MKTVKMSLDTIQGKLSRAEMKEIMAGRSPCGFMDVEYYCAWSGMGMCGGGYACGSNAGWTEIIVAATLKKEGIYADSVTCH